MEDLNSKFAYIKQRRHELRSAEYALAKQARQVADQALSRGVPVEAVADRLGYHVNVVRKWFKNSEQPSPKQSSERAEWRRRLDEAVREQDARSARRLLRLRRAQALAAKDGWRVPRQDPDERQGDCNM
jgi:AraC-like DNA-binding protein